MLTFFGIKVSIETMVSLFFFILFSWSEYLGGNKNIKSSNVAQQLYSFLRLSRKEDDKIARILKILKEDA